MTSETWADWIAYHGTAFGFRKEQDLQMLITWAELFRAAGHSPAEMLAASKGLVVNGRLPQFRTDQLAALLDQAKTDRAAAYRAGREEVADRGECVLCGSIGLVIVPHPQMLDEGTLHTWCTCVVLCSCSLGRFLENGPRRGTLTLSEYQRRYPGWRDVEKQHTLLLMQRSRVEAEARSLDKSHGKIDRALSEILAHAKRRAENNSLSV